MGIIYYGFSLQCSVCHDSARNKKKKSFVDILRKNGWCFLIAVATTSNPLFFISVNTYGQEIMNLKPFVDWFTHLQLTKMAQMIRGPVAGGFRGS